MSSWYEEEGHSLFTYFFVRGLQGEADRDQDRVISAREMMAYLAEEVPYWARRLNGRDQEPLLVGDEDIVLARLTGEVAAVEVGPGKTAIVTTAPGEVARLLREAEAHLEANRLTTPPGSNALEALQEVLRLDPGNEHAEERLKQLVGRYVDLAEGRMADKDWARAETFLDRASGVIEGDKRVLAARARLAEATAPTTTTTTTTARPTATTLPPRPPEPPKHFTNSIGMKLVLVPAGSFLMGSPEGQGSSDEHPRHRVTITRPFYLGVYEVTQAQWRAVMGGNPSRFKGDDLPVESVSWDDAQEFIRKLNQKERTDKYRLLTEAEWEHACRAGSAGKWCLGDDEGRLGKYA